MPYEYCAPSCLAYPRLLHKNGSFPHHNAYISVKVAAHISNSISATLVPCDVWRHSSVLHEGAVAATTFPIQSTTYSSSTTTFSTQPPFCYSCIAT